MSTQIAFPRKVLQRVSDRRNRKLATDSSDEISSPKDEDSWIVHDSQLEVVEESQSPLKGHRDLFGELIPDDACSKSPPPKNKAIKNTNKKKQAFEEMMMHNPIIRPTRVFIPTKRIVNLMKEAQMELYSIMGHNKSSSDVSVVSTDSLNMSGVQNLLDSPTSSKQNNCTTNETNEAKSLSVFEGVVAFVDYKVDNDRSSIGIINRLIDSGAKVEKTFNRKVTHVVFRDGYRKTYQKALQCNIPLVSARWIEDCKLANKILDPAEYPPVDIEKYKIPKVNFNLPKSCSKYKKFLRPSDIDRDNQLKAKCDNFIKNVNSLMNTHNETEEKSIIIETPKTKITNEPVDPYKTNDVISILSDQLCKVLNTNDSSLLDEDVDELYLPMSIKVLRKYLTPKGSENKTPTELSSDIAKIEDRLNLNSQARQRLRKLLFPLDKEINNISVDSDFPTPSPQKPRTSAPPRLTSMKKRKLMLDKENELGFQKNMINDENKVSNNRLQWQIPSDLRPKKIRKIQDKKEKSQNIAQTQESILSKLSRNSSMIFQTPKDSLASPEVLQTITCTGMKKSEVEVMKQSIQNLGNLSYQNRVEPSTTYVITKARPKRTLNLVFAMAFGCYIISENWVHESHKIGRWLPHQLYCISDLSEPVKAFQIRRNTFGSLLTFHIFDSAGSIFLSDTCEPSARNLKRLIHACGGICTSIEATANIVVGYTSLLKDNIHEKWILDCITQGILLDKSQYKIQQ